MTFTRNTKFCFYLHGNNKLLPFLLKAIINYYALNNRINKTI